MNDGGDEWVEAVIVGDGEGLSSGFSEGKVDGVKVSALFVSNVSSSVGGRVSDES